MPYAVEIRREQPQGVAAEGDALARRLSVTFSTYEDAELFGRAFIGDAADLEEDAYRVVFAGVGANGREPV